MNISNDTIMYNLLNSLTVITSITAIIGIPYFTWTHFINVYKKEKSDFQDYLLWSKRHNCVLMYAKGKGYSGWPPQYNRTSFDLTNLNLIYEPIIYFIKTAKKSLDFCVMNINLPEIIDQILETSKSGVKIRILSDLEMCSSKCLKKLSSEGVEVLCYVAKIQGKGDSLMHQKYIIKDYSADNSALFIGSFNVSNNSMWNTYDHIVITQSQEMLNATHNNFQHLWSTISNDNKQEFNQFRLRQHNLK